MKAQNWKKAVNGLAVFVIMCLFVLTLIGGVWQKVFLKIGLDRMMKETCAQSAEETMYIDKGLLDLAIIGWTNSLEQLNYDADVIMIGDSIVEHGKWQNAFPNHRIINLGVGGNTIEQVSDRAEMISVLQPEQVFVLVGINNYPVFDDETLMEDLYKELITKVKACGCPRIYMISITPITEEAEKRLGTSNDKIDSINEIIKNICEEEGIPYINASEKLKKENHADELYTSGDGLHLNTEGYQRIYSALQPLISGQ